MRMGFMSDLVSNARNICAADRKLHPPTLSAKPLLQAGHDSSLLPDKPAPTLEKPSFTSEWGQRSDLVNQVDTFHPSHDSTQSSNRFLNPLRPRLGAIEADEVRKLLFGGEDWTGGHAHFFCQGKL